MIVVAVGIAEERHRAIAPDQRRDMFEQPVGEPLAGLSAVDLAGLDAIGVRFISLEDGLDTTTPVGRLFLQIRGAFAEYEHALIQERCDAGREAARKRGVHLGRPRNVTAAQEARVRRLRTCGRTIREIAQVVELPRTTVHRVLHARPAQTPALSAPAD